MYINLPQKAKTLIEKTGSNETPVIVPICVEEGAKPLYCFSNVESKIKKDGGSVVYGWIIWAGELMFEAEFHAIWKSCSGNLVDITPHEGYDDAYILFLPDTNVSYKGELIGNIRISNINNPLMDDLIKVCDFLDKVKAGGKKVGDDYLLSGSVAKFAEILLDWRESLTNFINDQRKPNDYCFCGLPFSYEDCHGNNIAENLEMIYQVAKAK